jgi:hypothetical protein
LTDYTGSEWLALRTEVLSGVPSPPTECWKGKRGYRRCGCTKCPIEVKRLRVFVVGKHESLPNAFSRRGLPQRVEERAADAFPLPVHFDCEVIDKQLSPLKAGEGKVKAGDATDNLLASKRCERPKITAI